MDEPPEVVDDLLVLAGRRAGGEVIEGDDGDVSSPVLLQLRHVPDGIGNAPLEPQVHRAVSVLVVIREQPADEQLDHDIVRPLLDFSLVPVACVPECRRHAGLFTVKRCAAVATCLGPGNKESRTEKPGARCGRKGLLWTTAVGGFFLRLAPAWRGEPSARRKRPRALAATSCMPSIAPIRPSSPASVRGIGGRIDPRWLGDA